MTSNPNNRVQNNPRLTNKGYPSIEEIIKARCKMDEIETPKESKPYNEIGLSLDLCKDNVVSVDHRVKVNMLPIGSAQMPVERAKVDVYTYKPCALHELLVVDIIKCPFKQGEGNVNIKITASDKFNNVKVQLFPTPNLDVTCTAPGTTIGWNDVPRRPQGKLRRRRGLPYSILPIDPTDADGIPVRDHRRAPSPTWGGRKNSRNQGWARGIHKDNTFMLADPQMFTPVKVQFLMSDPTHSYYKDKFDELPKLRKLGDANTSNLKFTFQSPSKFLANGAYGPWGIDHIKVSLEEKKDKAKYSCPNSCIRDLYIFPPRDIHNWWVTAKYPHGDYTRRKIRDLVLSKLSIAKLFAALWVIPRWKQRLLGASKNYRIQNHLVHNKEYCPTLFNTKGDNCFHAFHMKHRLWIDFPSFDFVPINIIGMLGGDGGLLLLYGNDKPKEVIQRGKRTLHIPPWQALKRKHDSHLYPNQHILVVCNPITRAYRFLPPFNVFLESPTARMMVSHCGGFYTIYFMGWHLIKEPELCVAIYNSFDECWIEHMKPFKARELISTAGYVRALPLIKNGPDGGLKIYNVCEMNLDLEKPLEFKPYVIAYCMNTLTWIIHMWVQDQSLPPSVPADPLLFRADPPTLLECNNHLFGVARSFKGTKAFIQIYKLLPPTPILTNDPQITQSHAPLPTSNFVPYGPPMPSKYFHMNFPRNLHPYEVPLELNCVSGMGNIWIAPPNTCLIVFFNVKIKEWSSIASIKIDQYHQGIQIGNWAFQPAIHAIV